MAHVSRFLVLLMVAGTVTAFSQERWQARSMVISKRGIVATSQTLASQAGAQVLARGGSAMDAAIAANAALGVVEPMMNGIGGDLFVLYREGKTGKLTGINASGWSPQGLTAEVLKSKRHYGMPQDGIDSVTVPGCVNGWEKLHQRFGRLKWNELFQPAIYYAREGFPVTELIQGAWDGSVGKLRADENARRVHLKDGKAPRVGELFRNPALGKALALIAAEGASAFYRGAIAKSILATSKRLGGLMSAADLAEYQSEWVEPVSTSYRGWKVYELPPNGQGMAVLSMLNIMERFPLGNHAPLSPEAFHLKIEAQKLAYADLQRYLGDPRFGPVPVSELISKRYAGERASLVQADKAACSSEAGNPISSAGDTIYLSVVDADGNVASLIQSIYLSFGSGVVVDDYGFHLHNRGGLFVLDKGHPNELQPRKRPFHTIIPGYMEKDHLHVGFGIMGGLNQAQAHAQFVSNFIDHEMNLQGALEAPRFTKLTFSGCDVMIEDRVPQTALDSLREKGHFLQIQGPFSSWMGGGQAVMHDSTAKVNYAGSSPRKDGAAVPEPDPYFVPRPARAR
ncbi:MAG: gamma-glutamyltransferase [Acidobacteriia bacterium]|nr:gamma-glutamyltransferase [Terriglobia bacterium]